MIIPMSCWYYDKRDLRRSPSILDGIDIDQESRYRREGARFIINVGTKMGLRYDTMATGVVFFHRFYMCRSFKIFPRFITACGCLLLAGKVEETPKKCKDMIRVSKSFLTDAQFAQFGDDPKEEVMTMERILLQTVNFDLQVDHPYGYLLKYAKCLKGDKVKLQKMVQMAWTFINDSLCTTLCLQWEPEIIAIALMYLAGKLSKFEVVDWNGRAAKHTCWWDMFVEGMSLELLEDICHQVLDLYSTVPPENLPPSPPATPPTKSKAIRKAPAPSSTQEPPPEEPPTVPTVVSSSKPKEVAAVPVVGQPIPLLEPGELKIKIAAKTLHRKASTEAKASRSSSSKSGSKKSISSSGSPTRSSATKEDKTSTKEAASASVTKISSGSNVMPIETVYQSDMNQYSQPPIPQTTADTLTAAMTQPGVPHASVGTAAPQYFQANTNQAAYVVPEPTASYTADPKQQYVQSTTYFNAPVPPTLPSSCAPVVNQPPHLLRPQYPEMYTSQPPPTTQVVPPPLPQAQYPLPPPPPRIPVAGGQYSVPPPQPAANMMMPNVPIPLHNPANLSQPPPMPHGLMHMPPGTRADLSRIPPPNLSVRPPGPRSIAPSPRMRPPPPHLAAGPRSSVPRSEKSNSFRHEEHSGMDQSLRTRLNVPRRPPSFFREGRSQEYGQGSGSERDRAMPQYSNQRDVEYDDEMYDESSYSEYGEEYEAPGTSYSGGSHSYDGNNSNQSPFRRGYNSEHQPFNAHERGPHPQGFMSNLSHPGNPTGIALVRITGRNNNNNRY